MCGKLQLTISHIHSDIGYMVILKGSKFCGLDSIYLRVAFCSAS